MISKRFIKTSFIYTVAGSLPMASALILLPFYIAYLPTSVYGALSLCIAISMLVQVVVTYSFDTTLYVYYHEYKNDFAKLSSFVSSVFVFIVALGTLVAMLAAVSGFFVFDVFFKNATISFFPYGYLSVLLGVFQAVFKVHSNLLQSREKPEPFFWANVLTFAVIATTSIVGLKYFPNSLIGPLGGRVLASAGGAVWTLARIFKEFGFHFQNPWQQSSFRFNAFAFIYQLLQWGINYFDKFLMLLFLPLSVIGLYDFALRCAVPIDLTLYSLSATINPKVVSIITKQETKTSTVEINRYFYGLISVILLLICSVIIFVPPLADIFIKKNNYIEAMKYVPLVSLIYVFKAMRLYFVLPFTTLKKMDSIMSISLVVNLVKAGLIFLFATPYGLYGVIASAMIAFLLEIFLLWSQLKKYYAIAFNAMKLMVVPMLFFIVVLSCELIFKNNAMLLWIRMSYGALCMGLLAFAFCNELKTVYQNYKIK